MSPMTEAAPRSPTEPGHPRSGSATEVSMRAARRPTEFERRVYKVISAIPKGQTRSYRWVAEQLGDVNLARAVGNALGRNPYAPRVPCHRVIKTDGSLGGYAGGLAKKLALLREEGWKAEKAISSKCVVLRHR